MKRITGLFFAFICLYGIMPAYDNSLYNIKTPVKIEKGIVELTIKHDFYGKFIENGRLSENLTGSFFETNQGAVVGLGIRYIPAENLEISVAKQIVPSKVKIGAGYGINISGMDTEVFLELISGNNKMTNFYLASLGWNIFDETAGIVVNAGYDTENNFTGIGIGTEVAILKNSRLFFEYWPIIDPKAEKDGKLPAFNTGIKIIAGGHQFYLSAGNNFAADAKEAMQGAPDNNINLGFKITRILFL